MAKMVEEGVPACAMEVVVARPRPGSRRRCALDTAVFTNPTRDHLDFHEGPGEHRP